MISSSTSANTSSTDYASQLQTYLAGGGNAAAGASSNAPQQAPSDSFVEAQASAAPGTYSQAAALDESASTQQSGQVWVWVDTSYDEVYEVTETVEYSYYSHTEVETVWVSAGHWEESSWIETQTYTEWVDESYSYDIEHVEYGGTRIETVYVHAGYWETREETTVHVHATWVDDSAYEEVYTDIYLTGHRTETRLETRHISQGHWELVEGEPDGDPGAQEV